MSDLSFLEDSPPNAFTSNAEEFSIGMSERQKAAPPKKTGNQKKRKKKNNKAFINWKKRQIDPNTFLHDDEMTRLNIPPFLQHVYLSGIPDNPISKFRDWQRSLFETNEWKEGKNTIILVPTSGGKTVAADVAISQLLANDKKAKAILALPFVALANEKYTEYVQRFFPYSVRPFYMNVGGNDFHRGQIAVCTFEKAHSIINSALSGGYSDQIKLIIIDEVHMLGDESRGPVIEALIVKAMLMKNNPRIIGMTATINQNDAIRLSKWINGFPFICETRPSQVKQFIKSKDGDLIRISADEKLIRFHKLKNVPGDQNHIIDPIRTLLSRSTDSSIIIFVNSRAQTLKTASMISLKIYDNKLDLPVVPPPSPEVAEARKKLLQDLTRVTGTLDQTVASCIAKGIGVHHAGLMLEERRLIESAARKKTLFILVATTTLSAGVNIHSVSRVFITDIYRTGFSMITKRNEKTLIPSSQFTQMIGRAGRSANRPGDAIIIAHSDSENEMNDIIKLSKHQIDDLVPHLLNEGQLDRFFLQCLSTNLVPPKGGLIMFISKTLSYANTMFLGGPSLSESSSGNTSPSRSFSNSMVSSPEVSSSSSSSFSLNMPSSMLNESGTSEIKSIIEDDSKNSSSTFSYEIAAKRLIDKGLINKDTYEATPLGRAIASSSVSIEEGIFLESVIQNIQKNLCLDDELHLLYLCVSPSIAETIKKKEPYDSNIWVRILKEHTHVIQLITGLKNYAEIDRIQDLPRIYGGLGRVNPELDSKLDRVFIAAILYDLINEVSVSKITRLFNVERGMIQSLQMQCASFAGQTSRFCEMYGSVLLASTLNRFRQRLSFAARSELLALMVLPSISKGIARILYDAGLPSPIEVSNLNKEALAAIIASVNEKGEKMSPTEADLSIASSIHEEATEYTKSLAKMEQLEEIAIQKASEM